MRKPSFRLLFLIAGNKKSPVRLLPCTNGHLLKGKDRSKFLAARPERAEASFWQHALKGQKLLAQGHALGKNGIIKDALFYSSLASFERIF